MYILSCKTSSQFWEFEDPSLASLRIPIFEPRIDAWQMSRLPNPASNDLCTIIQWIMWVAFKDKEHEGFQDLKTSGNQFCA